MKIKLYSKLSATMEYESDFDEKDYNDYAFEEISNEEIVPYFEAIKTAIASENSQLPAEKGLAEFFHSSSDDLTETVNKKLVSMFPSVEIIDDTIYGVMECELSEALNDQEQEALEEYISGQYSDGWGESFEQKSIKTDMGNLFIHFWKNNYFELLTEIEVNPRAQNELKSKAETMGSANIYANIHGRTITDFPISRKQVEYLALTTNEGFTSFDFNIKQPFAKFILPIEELDKANHLYEALDKLDSEQLDDFVGFVKVNDMTQMEDLIITAETLEAIIVIPKFDESDLGEFLIDGSYYDFADNVIDLLDEKRVAKHFLAHNPHAKLTDYGYIEDNRSDKMKQIEIQTDSYYRFNSAFFIVEIEFDDRAATVDFPMDDEKITRLMRDFETNDDDFMNQCEVIKLVCRYPNLLELRMNLLNLHAVNELAKALEPLDTKEYIAVMDICETYMKVNNVSTASSKIIAESVAIINKMTNDKVMILQETSDQLADSIQKTADEVAYENEIQGMNDISL